MSDSLEKLLSADLTRIRTSAGMTHRDLAAATGISQEHIARIESKGKNVTLKTIESFATALGVDPLDLLAVKRRSKTTPKTPNPPFHS